MWIVHGITYSDIHQLPFLECIFACTVAVGRVDRERVAPLERSHRLISIPTNLFQTGPLTRSNPYLDFTPDGGGPDQVCFKAIRSVLVRRLENGLLADHRSYLVRQRDKSPPTFSLSSGLLVISRSLTLTISILRHIEEQCVVRLEGLRPQPTAVYIASSHW